MPAEQDPKQAERDEAPERQPDTADFERYDEAVADKVEGIDGASAGGPAS
jgi:hypothetical protein